jgi:hypothetical protein
MGLRELVILNDGLRYSPAHRDGKPMDKLLPKDSAELARLEKVYGMATGLFQSVVDVNHVMQQLRPKEVLDGPNQVSFKDMVVPN